MTVCACICDDKHHIVRTLEDLPDQHKHPFYYKCKKDHNTHFSLDYSPQLTALLFLSHPHPFVFLSNTYYDFSPFQTLFCFELSTCSVVFTGSLFYKYISNTPENFQCFQAWFFNEANTCENAAISSDSIFSNLFFLYSLFSSICALCC